VDAAEALAPESGLIAQLDPAGFGDSLLSVIARAAGRPAEVAAAGLRFGATLARIWPVAASRWLGSEVAPPMPIDARDRRFADPAWDDNPGYFAVRQAYLAARRLSEDLPSASASTPSPRRISWPPTPPQSRRHSRPAVPACWPVPAISSTIWRTTADARARSIRHRSSWAGTSQQPRDGWSSATT
jgi:hypothetical protein